MNHIVICRGAKKEDGSPGDYTQATRTPFPTQEAAEKYASSCSPEQEALVVSGPLTEPPPAMHTYEEVIHSISESGGWSMTTTTTTYS